MKETTKLNNVGLCHQCKSLDNLTKEKREEVKKGARCIDVINKCLRMITKLATKSKRNSTHVVAYDYEGEMIYDRRRYFQNATTLAWCHRLNGAPKRTQGSSITVELKHTHVMTSKNTRPIPMIEQLNQCASNYDKPPTFMLVAHNGTGHDDFHLFKDLAQFEQTTDYRIRYNKIRKEGIRNRYVEITFISYSSLIMV